MKCVKHRYRDELDAKIALTFMPDNPQRREVRAYRCPRCRGWHLTSWTDYAR